MVCWVGCWWCVVKVVVVLLTAHVSIAVSRRLWSSNIGGCRG